MKPYFLIIAACIFLTSIIVVPDVYAQFGGGMGGSGTAGGRRGGGDHASKGCDGPDKASAGKGPMAPAEPMNREQVEYQLGAILVDLRLTPEQAPVWQAFAGRVLALADDVSRQRARSASAGASYADGVKSISTAVDAARNHLTALEDIESAEKALYQTLQSNQKTLADLRFSTFLPALFKA